jgi:hypothetical protein
VWWNQDPPGVHNGLYRVIATIGSWKQAKAVPRPPALYRSKLVAALPAAYL